MNRCLHFTINENAVTLPRRGGAADLYGRASSDPEEIRVMSPIDDPGSSYISGPMATPEAIRIMSPIDDPSDPPYLSGSSGGRGEGEVVATTCSCCCAPACHDTAAPGKTTPHPFIGPRDYSGFVIVRMADGIESEYNTLWELAENHTPKLKGLQAVLELPVKPKVNDQIPEEQPAKPPEGTLASRPLVELYKTVKGKQTPLPCSESRERIHELETKTARTAFPPLHSLTSYWRLDLREHSNLVKKVVARLNRLAEVGLAYRELAATDPRGAANGQVFSEDQGYLDDAPTGISASWARSLKPTPSTMLTLCDLEQGWNLDHKDLNGLVDGPLFGVNRAQGSKGHPGHHGTAVLGLLVADGKNVQGIANGIARFVVASHYDYKDDANGNVAAAITQALSSATLKAGDILLIEVQRGLLPAEVEEEDLNAIRLAAGLGIIVIEAAGNGGFNLDAYNEHRTGRSLRRGDPRLLDSGAILVGASRAGLPHDRALFSNYGSRLDCFGWGEAVTTCGYGNLAGTDAKDSYTNTFSGTSSASAIIAGAAALLQSLHEANADGRLGPQEMREILADPMTGTRQGPNVPGNIGAMPDLKAIVRNKLQLVPDVYLRRSIADDGSVPASGDEISSSPDILVWREGPGKTRDRYSEKGQRKNTPAPGELIKPAEWNDIYVRLCNRGLGPGEADVQLFASPAATLITPERWIPVGAAAQGGILQGDTLFVAGPFGWKPPSLASLNLKPDSPWSFLAVLSRYGEGHSEPAGSGLPPGPPYFDWTKYRTFLRGPGVAWRNTHRVVSTTPSAPLALTFWIAGTPDRARHFDFEVIQRLPAGATVTMQMPPALAAKLHQRQPLLKENGGLLALPRRPLTAIRGVELAAGTYAGATFTVNPGSSALTASHSLAIRQLWRGEEVGRITWFFGPDA